MRLLIAWLLASLGASAATLQVGSGQTHATIGAAITASSANDTINVHAGTYTESPTLSKALTLQNNSGDAPIISGSLTIGANNCTVNGMNITGFGSSGSGSYGIFQTGRTGNTIENCTVHDGFGTAIYARNSTVLLITNNTCYNMTDTAAASGTGLIVISGHSTDATYGNGITIANNTIHDNPVDGIEVHGQYITVVSNYVYNNIDVNWATTHPDGIQLLASTADTFTTVQHCRIYNNIFKNHTQNIFTEGTLSGQSSDCQDVSIWNNVVYMDSGTVNGVNLDSLGGTDFVIKFSRDVFIYNNYCGRASGGGIHVQTCFDGSIHIKNNIIQNTSAAGYGVYVEDPNDISSGELDYNQYNITGSSAVTWNATSYASRTAFNAGVATMEVHGADGNPLVNALPSPSLTSSSPCRDTGVSVGSPFNTDKAGVARPQGSAWDIGAFEFQTIFTDTLANCVLRNFSR